MIVSGRPCLVTLEMHVSRAQPDGSVAVEHITVKQKYDADGQPVGPATEERVDG